MSASDSIDGADLALPDAASTSWTPLAHGQLALWLIAESGVSHDTYTVSLVYELRGALDKRALRAAFTALLDRHEALRTAIEERGGIPMQRPVENADLDWREAAAPEGTDTGRLVERLTSQPFDLRAGRLMRVALVELASRRHLLVVAVHHIACDGVSVDVIVRELASAYDAALEGGSPAMPALPLQYRHFAAWSNERLASGALADSRRYWIAKLSGAPVIDVPADRPRPIVRTHDGSLATQLVPDDVVRRFRSLCAGERSTVFAGMCALLRIVLSRYTGERDFAIGTSAIGRTRPEWEDQVGYYLNTVALRDELHTGATVRDVIRQSQRTLLDALRHQEYPFHELVREIGGEAPPNRNPLFDVMLMLDGGWGGAGLALTGLGVTRWGPPRSKSKVDVTVFCVQTADGLRLDVEYSTELFDATRMERLLAHLETLMRSGCATPDADVDALEMLPDAERRRLLVDFNDTARPYHLDRTLQSLFAEQAARAPERVATVDDERSLTFAELDAESDGIAAMLRRDFAVGPGTFVALHMARSVDLTAAILGVLKSGAAYLPLSLDDPHERLAGILEDAAVRVVLTSGRTQPGRFGDAVTAIDVTARRWPRQPAELAGRPGDPAYCIFTSGSTGRPNGVVVEHRAVVNRLAWMIDQLRLTADDVFLQKTPYTFDVSVWELLLPGLLGARQVVLAPGAHGDPDAIARAIGRHGVTIAHFVPSMLNAYLTATSEGFRGVRHCVCSGEALGLDLVRRFFAATRGSTVRLHNYYGPTEAAVDVMSTELHADASRVTIGRPAPNNHAYVLTDAGALAPIGVPGHLHLGGVQIARGYLSRPELDARRFSANPFHEGVMYRTGDLAAWLDDGTLAYLGRGDRQVKLRGLRIELEEVEIALAQVPGVARAVVALQRDESGTDALCAYLECADSPDPERLRAQLGRRLPPYMVPDHYVRVHALPLTANGKLDRGALVALSNALVARRDRMGPRSETEARLLDLWHELLPASDLGVTDDFFAVGGNSLSALRLAARIDERLGAAVTLAGLLSHPTVEAQARLVEDARAAGVELVPDERPDDRLRHELSPAQHRIWYLHLLGPDSSAYTIHLVVRLDGPVDAANLQRAVDVVVARHEMLRVTFGDLDGVPYQQVHDDLRIELAVEDLGGPDGAARARSAAGQRAAERISVLGARPLDLRGEAPFRAVHLRLGPDESWLSLSLHHIVADGWSVQVLLRDLAAAYTSLVRGEPPGLPAPRTRYVDYARAATRAARNSEASLGFWEARLAGLAPLDLPADAVTSAAAETAADEGTGRVSLRLEGGACAALRGFAASRGVTLFDVTMSALMAYLSRMTGQSDVAVGFPIANRSSVPLEDVVGLFLNTLVLRTTVAEGSTFEELLQAVRGGLREAYDHQEVPFETVVERLNPARRLDRSPLFDVMLNFVGDLHGELPAFAGVPVTLVRSTQRVQAKLPLTLYVETRRDALVLDLVHRRDLFSARRAGTLLRQFAQLLDEALRAPDRPIDTLSLVPPEERARLERALSTPIDQPELATVPALVAAAARRRPSATAVQQGDRRLTYQELLSRSAAVSRLVAARVGAGEVVCVHGPRGIGFVVALLGVLSSPAVVFPLDGALPAGRRARLAAAARPRLVLDITGGGTGERAWDGVAVDAVDADTGTLLAAEPNAAEGAAAAPDPRSPAYLFFTSGTTGTPRGVLGWHGALSQFLLWQADAFGVTETDVFAQTTNASFDVMLRDTLLALVAGGRLVIPDRDDRAQTGRALLRWMRHERVSVLHAVPSVARSWLMESDLSDGLPALRFAFFAGEPLKAAFVEDFRSAVGDAAEIVNLYGPTETTLAKCFHRVPRGPLPPVLPVGRPMPQCEVYVMRGAALSGVAEPGEIVIRTPMRTLGYHRDPDATRRAFRENPHLRGEGASLYYTGDIGRVDERGLVEVLGRYDDQLKINGVRLQPAEAENAITSHPDIATCAVAGAHDDRLGTVLVAYVVTGMPPASLPARMRGYLSQVLATSMVPSRWVVLDAIPLTPNGKLDRRALAAMPLPPVTAGSAWRPLTAVEQDVLAMWHDVLGRTDIGVEDDFFTIGGSSLTLLRLYARLDQRFPRRLRVAQLFSHTTVAAQAAIVGPPASAEVSETPAYDL